MWRTHCQGRKLPSPWASICCAMLAFSITASVPAANSNAQTAPDKTFDDSQIEFFESKIRPLLVEHCLECHGAEPAKVRGGLWLTSREQMLEGGDTGPAIVPGEPDESLLIEAVRYEDYEMPPQGMLTAEQIELLELWVRQGAPDPRQPSVAETMGPPDIESGRAFWSFQPLPPIQQPTDPTPTADNDQRQNIRSFGHDSADWCETRIDEFIFDAYHQNGIAPVADADRHQLLRRTHLALTGLPPTAEEIARFVSLTNPINEDLADVIDRLLASPRFGERWGRHWLDVARFAESSGGGRSLMFPDAWRFRDYVIASFNNDKPFDQMVRQQIAGDLLPFESREQRNENITASGFLALGPINYEQQDKEALRMEVIDEQVDTVGRAFLGMTLGCARCHDHKFDPIPMSDYYALAGIFGSTESLVDGNVSSYVTQSVATQHELDAHSEYQARLKTLNLHRASLEKRIAELGGPQSQQNVGTPATVIRSQNVAGIVVDNEAAQLVGEWTRSTSVKAYVDAGYVHDANQPKGNHRAVFQPKLETGGTYEVRLAYSAGGNRATNTLIVVDHQDGRFTRRLDQTETPPIDGLFVSLGEFRFEANNLASVTIDNTDTDGVVIADAVVFLPKSDQRDGQQPDAQPQPNQTGGELENSASISAVELRHLQQDLKRVNQQVAELKKTAPSKLPVAMSVKDSPSPADGHIHIRGNVRQLGDAVPRGFLQVVTPADQWPAIPADASGRLQLAQWIASEHNPLTARVYVNRIWRHLFGRGLVESTDNFGKMGTGPSHPELLDYLAASFVADGWSTKRLIRRIMLSHVFRLDSRTGPAKTLDPDNRWLWRAQRRRMDAEILRDCLLHASGELDLTPGGLTIRKLSQYDLGYEFNSFRRSVYVPAFRNSMLDLFEIFDIANPNVVTGHRNTSTLPTQALFLMNSPWVIERTARMAESICAESETAEQRLRSVYLRLLGRPPHNSEAELALQFIKSSTSLSDRQRWQTVIHAVVCSIDFRYIH